MASWDFRPHGTIVDGETFACVTELQMRQAARLQYAVSMLTIHQSGNGYVADPGDGAQELAEVVSPLIRDTDLIEAVPAAGTVRVLLVGGELEDLDIIIRRIITEVSHHRFDERRLRAPAALVEAVGALRWVGLTPAGPRTAASVWRRAAGLTRVGARTAARSA